VSSSAVDTFYLVSAICFARRHRELKSRSIVADDEVKRKNGGETLCDEGPTQRTPLRHHVRLPADGSAGRL